MQNQRAMGPPGSSPAAGGQRAMQWKGKTIERSTPGTAPPSADGAPPEPSPAESPAATTAQRVASVQALQQSVDDACSGIEEIYALLVRLSERDNTNEKVFNVLHAELSDYKKDFIYEHLKPVIRPLLFLYDSLEQFEDEIMPFEAPSEALKTAPTLESGLMPTRTVRQNTVYFREQLVEALRICEVTQMDKPEGKINPRFHKAISVETVPPEEDGCIRRVVRTGWFLNGQLLRPAEVIVGKARVG